MKKTPFVDCSVCNLMISSDGAGAQLLALSLKGCTGGVPTSDHSSLGAGGTVQQYPPRYHPQHLDFWPSTVGSHFPSSLR